MCLECVPHPSSFWPKVCSSRKYPYPPRKVIGNSEGEGGSEAKISEGSGGSSLAFFPEGGKQFVTIEKGIEINYFPLSLNVSCHYVCVFAATFLPFSPEE